MELTAAREDAVSTACVDELLAHPELEPPSPAERTDRSCVVEPATWWPNAGDDPVAQYHEVSVGYNGRRAVTDRTAFLTAEFEPDGGVVGRLIEVGPTEQIFTDPADERTEAYASGRFG